MVEGWQIIVAVGVFVVGIGVGMLLRPGNKKLVARAEEAEAALQRRTEELASHRTEVEKHFEQTSDLFRDLTQQYTSLYAHLAEGARTLAPDRMLEIGQGFNLSLLERGGGEQPAEVEPEPTPVVETAASKPEEAADEAKTEAPAEGETPPVESLTEETPHDPTKAKASIH